MKDFIGNYFDEGSLDSLESGHPLCINSPPGSGKTTLVTHQICDCARRRDEKVLLLVNRRVLREELYFKMLQMELEKEISDSRLWILEIQSIEGSGKKARKLREEITEYKFVCVDECHYFVQDARFNPRTQVSFEYLADLLPSHIFFFLSGTPEEFIDLMNRKLDCMHQLALQEYEEAVRHYEKGLDEKIQEFAESILKKNPKKHGQFSSTYKAEEYLEEWKRREQIFPPEKPVRMKLEVFDEIAPDYSGVDIWHFRNLDDLVPRIIGDKGSYLIFVNSKKEGRRIKNLLNSKFEEKAGVQKVKNRAVFVDSNYQSEQETKKVMKKIIKQGKLKVKVLITTSVLDNGINILDHNLTNLVLMTFDDTDAIQMIGRKRLRDGERLNLYLPYGTAKFFSRQLRSVIHDYECLRSIANNGFRISSDNLLGNGELLKRKDKFFYKVSEGTMQLGKISFFKLYRQYDYAKKILDGLQENENFFLEYQYHRLGLELKADDIIQKDVCKGDIRKRAEAELEKIKAKDYPIISKSDFDTLAHVILPDCEGESNFKSLQPVNKLLHELGMQEKFERMSLGNTTFYYLSDMNFPSLRDAFVTKEKIASEIEFLEDVRDIYQKLFVEDIPVIFKKDGEFLVKFVNETLKREGWNISIQKRRSGYYEVREKPVVSKTEQS